MVRPLLVVADFSRPQGSSISPYTKQYDICCVSEMADFVRLDVQNRCCAMITVATATAICYRSLGVMAGPLSDSEQRQLHDVKVRCAVRQC
jgi:hypothetical protein